jgi:Xaa-Pro aminopeptidase
MSKQARLTELQRRLADEKLDLLLSDDPDTVYFLTGFWGYLGMEFGRPTIVVVPRTGSPSLITPAMEAEMARALSWVDDLREWIDGIDGEWVAHLRALVPTGARIGIERDRMHPRIQRALAEDIGALLLDGASILSAMRMVKTPDEIAIMRQAGEVAIAMVEGARGTISEGVPEYEVALAVITAGTRKAAQFLSADGPDRLISPTIHNLQIMQSGRHTCMVHGRSTVKRLAKGDPVYLCFCGIANFKQFKLGFDREFFVGHAGDAVARLYETAVRAQQTALSAVRPGAIAEEVHAEAEEVYRSAGFGFSYRTGRGIGYSFLEEPQLKRGDKTRLQAGMTFAVDGGITVPGKIGARIGDSIVVTETGFEYLTPYPRELTIV